jgi:RND superfamily putative drug exporter
MPDSLARGVRSIERWSVLIVAGWVAAAGLANLVVPQLESVVASHSRPFLPAASPSQAAASQSAKLFGISPGDNVNYVVLHRDRPLEPNDRKYYDALVAALRGDTRHVDAVTDLWSSPLTAFAAQSQDRSAVDVMLQLSGALGTSKANSSVAAVRAAVARLNPPAGLHVYVTGPGATLVDEFVAIDRQMLTVIGITVVVITLLLMLVYRSAVALAVALIPVGLALAVARPVIASLGEHEFLEVSIFSVALLGALILGAGTDYSIFLIGRYQECRRRGIDKRAALRAAYLGVAPVIVGSTLTIAAALSCLSLAKVGAFHSFGIPCAIGVLIVMTASLTLTPALIALSGRRGWLEPPRSVISGRWRRIGVRVARWPGPIFVASTGLIVLLAIPLAGLHTSWNQPADTPADTESNRGYAVMDRHFPANQLFPDIVTVEAGHDLRNPSGLIAVERVARQLMAIPGVRMVQSPSRPAGTVPDEATFSYQAGVIGRQLGRSIDSLSGWMARANDLEADLSQMRAAVDLLGHGMDRSSAGMREIRSGADDLRGGMDGLQRNAANLSGYLDPLRRFVDGTADCPANPICAMVTRVVRPADDMIRDTAQIQSGTAKLTSGSSIAAGSLAAMPQTVQSMRDMLAKAQTAAGELRTALDTVSPQLHELTDYLHEIAIDFQGSAAGGFYLPNRALTDARYQEVLRALMSPDGHAARLLVYGTGGEWGADGALRARQIHDAVSEATKEGTLTPRSVLLVGVGPATRDLQELVHHDVVLLVGATLAMVFSIVALMLRSPVAGLTVIGTVVVSYAAALGVSVLIWQHLLDHPLHWSVAPIAFIALVAVGSDYNLLLALRIREEAQLGLATGIIRAFAGTGGVVTTAGIIFGTTMFALMSSTVASIAQLGSTVGIGLLLDTLVVRSFLLPSIIALLGRWFWWPSWTALRAPAPLARSETIPQPWRREHPTLVP